MPSAASRPFGDHRAPRPLGQARVLYQHAAMLPAPSLVRLAAVLLLGLSLLPRPAVGAQTKLCGGRSISVPLLGTYSFSVQAVYEDDTFAFRCDGDLHVANCYGNRASPATGDVTVMAPW